MNQEAFRTREAEEIVGISDNLLLPSEIDAELERLRKAASQSS